MASLASSLALSPSPAKLRPPLPSLGFLSSFAISACRSFRPSPGARISRRTLSIRALTLDFLGSFFEGGGDEEGGGPSALSAAAPLGDKEEPQCPPGLRRYETMAVLRPDMTEDERLALIQRYEEVIILFFAFLPFRSRIRGNANYSLLIDTISFWFVFCHHLPLIKWNRATC